MAGSIIGGIGLYTTIQGERIAAQAGADIADVNATIAERQAEHALERGREAETESRIRTRQLIGTQRARLAAQGVDVNQGSALDIQADTAAIGELDALTIRNNAALEAWGYRVGATSQRLQANFTRQAARSRAIGSILRFGARAFDRDQNPGRRRDEAFGILRSEDD